MITIPLWMRAVDAQLNAVRFSDWYTSNKSNTIDAQNYALVRDAHPFAWGADSIAAVIEAAASIPDDTVFNRHNLSDTFVFWWFEYPMLVPNGNLRSDVQAIVGCWGHHQGRNVFAVTLWYRLSDTSLVPGYSWLWQEHETLTDLLIRTKETYKNVSEEERREALYATCGVSRFLLAAFAWLDQKIVHVTEENGERHTRKRYEKIVKKWHPVLIVQLRKRAYIHPDGPTPGDPRQSSSYRFVVSGHWRHQACGPYHSDRKLIYIMPFIKGDEDTPFRPKLKVYEVTR